MPEIFRSLLIVLAIASMVFAVAKKPMLALGVSLQDFTLRRNAWFGITLAAFLSHNFWIFAAITVVILRVGAKRDSNTMAFVFAVIFAVPLFAEKLDGFGIVNYFFDVTYFRLISLFVLLPLYLSLRKEQGIVKFGSTTPDKFLIAYFSLAFFLQYQVDSWTNFLRTVFGVFIDVYLPYYVASRFFKNVQNYRSALGSLVLAGMLVGGVGAFELVKGWLLYSNLPSALGVEWGYGKYLSRGASLRALATSGQPIVLGYIMAVALGLYLFVGASIIDPKRRAAWAVVLLAGLVAPLSRGPWIGAAAAVFVFIAMQPKAISKLLTAVTAVVAVFLVMLVTPYGDKVVSMLPFVGTVDSENVVFRDRLLENSLQVIARNPFFGSFDFLQSPELEDLRGGPDGGIIDIVNSYISITLLHGVVGLSLFLGFFGSILLPAGRRLLQLSKTPSELHVLGCALVATLVAILIMIYSVSPITFVPIIYWMVAGMLLNFLQLAKVQADSLSVEQA